MGVRINKALGYGIHGFRYDANDPYNITDARFKADASDRIINADDKEFYDWILHDIEEANEIVNSTIICHKRQNHIDTDLSQLNADLKQSKKRPFYSAQYDPEYGRPDVLLFTPINWGEQYLRRNDSIDHAEFRYLSQNDEEGCQVLLLDDSCGIYPYQMAFRKPGTDPIPTNRSMSLDIDTSLPYLPDALVPATWARLRGSWSRNTPPIAGHEIARMIDDRYRPQISGAVVAYIYWLDIFEDFISSIQDFRPMVYTYWN